MSSNEKLPAAELLAPVGRRLKILSGSVAAQLVVGGSRFRVLQSLVGFGDILEFLLPLGILGDIRMGTDAQVCGTPS